MLTSQDSGNSYSGSFPVEQGLRTAQLTACSGDSGSQEEEGKGPVDAPEKQETPQEGAAVSVRVGVMGFKGVSGVGMKNTSSLW